MKKNGLISFLALLLLGSILSGQSESDTKLPSTYAIIKTYYESISNFDFDKMREICSTDFRLVESSGIYSLDEYIGFLEPDVGKVKIEYSFEDFQSNTELNISWITYVKNIKIITEGKNIALKTRESAIISNENDNMKLRMIHSTNMNK